MQNASKELSVKIGKDKKGKRLIEIGGEKAVYSMITSRFLPDKQQAAIERYLGVRSFPTYKLFNRDGNLLDLEVDPRRLENLARLLERLK